MSSGLSAPAWRRWLAEMPAYGINGISAGLGITLVYGLAALLGGHAAAVAASSGAVYASTADIPLPPARTWRRVLTGVLVGCLVSLTVSLLRPWPIAPWRRSNEKGPV